MFVKFGVAKPSLAEKAKPVASFSLRAREVDFDQNFALTVVTGGLSVTER
jgi:hypothetical protein